MKQKQKRKTTLQLFKIPQLQLEKAYIYIELIYNIQKHNQHNNKKN
jgi:hypothetical protein